MSDVGVEPFEPPVLPASGFWRVARPEGARRTWLVGPDGRATFLLGVNTVMRDTRRDGLSRCEGIGDYIRRRAASEAAHREWARLSVGASGGFAVARPYGFNSVGAFSETNDFDDSGGDALFSNVTGITNTAVGYHALFTNNGDPSFGEGSYNCAFGAFALADNSTGHYNSVVGMFAL